MNSNTLQGKGTNVGGQIKEGIGKAIGDEQLQGEGVADQLAGIVQQAYGRVRDFARDRPIASAALAGVVGLAVLNTLRGK